MVPRRFRLVSSGSTVAYGVVWDDRSCSVKWLGDRNHTSFIVWPDVDRAIERNFNGDIDVRSIPLVVEWID